MSLKFLPLLLLLSPVAALASVCGNQTGYTTFLKCYEWRQPNNPVVVYVSKNVYDSQKPLCFSVNPAYQSTEVTQYAYEGFMKLTSDTENQGIYQNSAASVKMTFNYNHLMQISKAMDGEAILTIHNQTLNRTNVSLQCAANGQPNWNHF